MARRSTRAWSRSTATRSIGCRSATRHCRCREESRRGRPSRSLRSKPSRCRRTLRRPSLHRPCSRKRRESLASLPATRCGSPSRSMRTGPDHLHAYRRRPDGGEAIALLAAPWPIAMTPATCPTAAPVRQQGQECAGSARGDPADRFPARIVPRSGDHARLYQLVFNRALAARWRLRGWSAPRSS